MPVIAFEAAKLTKEQKQALAKEFTEAASRITGLSQEGFYVFLKENELGIVGVGSRPLRDRKQGQMKITVITGSPHRKGTSELLADEFIRGAKEARYDVFRFDSAFE